MLDCSVLPCLVPEASNQLKIPQKKGIGGKIAVVVCGERWYYADDLFLAITFHDSDLDRYLLNHRLFQLKPLGAS